jgi:GH25 family lysozyme M1 (1,4-beta-N-acetylmuramidase)
MKIFNSFLRIIAMTVLTLTFGIGHAMAQRASGIDVSRFQGTINWTSVKGAGISFAWAQATRGAYLTNVNFVANMVNGKAAGVLMGAYHYAFPATNSPSVEADYFWNLAGPYIKADGKTLMPMLDMETFTGIVGATSYSDWANQWYNLVLTKAAVAGVTIKPVMYSSACSYCNMNSSSSIFGSWVANYSGADPQTGTPWSACSSCNLWGSGFWNFWQYSSSGSVAGITGAVDRDVFNGTTAQLSTWVVTASGPDTTAPVISAVTASGISDNSATITWSTDESSDSVVDYGTTTAYGLTASNPSLVVSHSVGLSGLTASTVYHYRVISKDAANNTATSGDFTFTTLAPGSVADIIIDNPAATVVGTWSTGSTATDRFGTDYRFKSQGTGAAYLQFTPNILTAGDYQVYEWHSQGSNRDAATPHIISYNGGTATINVNQQAGGGAWNLLGTFNFTTGTTKNVRITDAISTSGQIAMADAIKFVYAAPPAPPADPSGLTATAVSASQINLAWTDNSANENNFVVSRSTVAGGPYTDIATVAANSTSYNNTGLAASTTYYYVVRAINGGGSSALSNQASVTTQAPPAATQVHVSSITMSWVASGSRFKAQAVVNVKDANGVNVTGATVSGNFTGSINNSGLSGLSNGSGNSTITSTSSIRSGTVTFTVSNITGSNMTYNSAANVVTSAQISR